MLAASVNYFTLLQQSFAYNLALTKNNRRVWPLGAADAVHPIKSVVENVPQ